MHKIIIFLLLNITFCAKAAYDLNHETYMKFLFAEKHDSRVTYDILQEGNRTNLNSEIYDFEVPVLVIMSNLDEPVSTELILSNQHDRCKFKPRNLDEEKQILVGLLSCRSEFKTEDFQIELSKFKKQN